MPNTYNDPDGIWTFRTMCDWISQEGFDASRLKRAVDQLPTSTEPLRLALNEYYKTDSNEPDPDNVKPEFRKIAGIIGHIKACLNQIDGIDDNYLM